jgi:hypothetical protein
MAGSKWRSPKWWSIGRTGTTTPDGTTMAGTTAGAITITMAGGR